MTGDERLLAYLDGALPDDERRALEAELLRDEELAARLYDEIGTTRLLAHVPVRRRQPARRVLAWLAPLAAAAALLLLLLPAREPGPVGPVLRGQPGVVQLLSPAPGAATPPVEFRWSATAGATSYTLELYDGEGRRILAASTADTLHRVTPAELPATGGAGYWWVEALDARARVLGRSEARAILLQAPHEGTD